MLWWFEWIDQGYRYGVYRALSRFLVGEDLRGREARCVVPIMNGDGGNLWCRAWRTPNQWLGYAIDPAWSVSGGKGRVWTNGVQAVEGELPASTVTVEWWDADTGERLSTATIVHGGGRFSVPVPQFRRHIAFKIWTGNR